LAHLNALSGLLSVTKVTYFTQTLTRPSQDMNLSRSEFLFNMAAIISLVASIAIWFAGYEQAAIFIGIWVPSILAWMNFAAIKEDRINRGDK
jgi:hypothetical protein